MSWSVEEQARYDDGWAALCARVVQQWRRDGSPKEDRRGIDEWERVLREHEKMVRRQRRRTYCP